MNKMKKILPILLVTVMLSSCSVPSGGETSSSSPNTSSNAGSSQSGQKLVTAFESEPISLDPHIGNDIVTCTAIGLVNQGLLDTINGEILPGLAESYEVSDDGTVYTFKLRDAKWSDGVAVSAQQFVDTYVRMLTRKDAMDLAYLIFPIKNAEALSKGEVDASEFGCKAIDDKTLEVTLEGPYPFMKPLFAFSPFFPIRTDLAEKYGKDYGNAPDKIVSCGPFTLKEWTHGDRLIFEKNPNYWDASKVTLNEVTMLFIKDTNTLKNMYDTGEINFMTVPVAQMKTMESEPGFQYFGSGGVGFLCLSQKGTSEESAKIIKNKDFITALSLSIDREDYCKALYPNNTPLTSVINPDIGDELGGKWKDTYKMDNEYHQIKADIPKAKEHMQKACEALGYSSAKDMPKLQFITIEGELNRTNCEYFQNIWEKEFGIQVEIVPYAYAQFWDSFYGAPYDIANSGWGPDYDDPYTYLDMWNSNGGWNKTGWVSEEYNKLITDANKETDMKKRNEMFYKAEQILLKEAPIIPLMAKRGAFILNEDKIEGVTNNMFGPLFDFRYAKLK